MKFNWKFRKKDKSVFASEHEKLVNDALKIYDINELDYLKNQDELHGPQTFSPEFEQRMIQLFQKSDTELERKKKPTIRSFTHIPKIAAAAICTVIITVVLVGIKTDAILFPKFTYTLRKDEDSYAYIMEQKNYAKERITETYEMTYIPKKYKLEKKFTSSSQYYMMYLSENDDKCIYIQSGKNVVAKLDDNFDVYKEMVIGESKYYIMGKDPIRNIIWFANGYQYIIQANLPIKELIKMAQSIQKQ